jgi:hypothetical protein
MFHGTHPARRRKPPRSNVASRLPEGLVISPVLCGKTRQIGQ